MCIYKSERKISKISFYHETLLTTSSSSFSFVNYLFLLKHKTQKKLQILIMKHIKTRFHYSLHSIFEHLFNSNLTSSIWHSFAHILLKHDTHDRFFTAWWRCDRMFYESDLKSIGRVRSFDGRRLNSMIVLKSLKQIRIYFLPRTMWSHRYLQVRLSHLVTISFTSNPNFSKRSSNPCLTSSNRRVSMIVHIYFMLSSVKIDNCTEL